MVTHDAIGKFTSTQEDWTSSSECLQEHFAANDVMNAVKQHAIFLSTCGASMYQLIRNLVSPAKLSDKSYFKLTKLIQDQKHSPPSVTI